MKYNSLKQLEKIYKKPIYIYTDPIKYIYQFKENYNKELVGLIIALFSYGNVKAMFQFMDCLIDFLKPDPYEKILTFKENSNMNLYYRFQNQNDIKTILIILKQLIKNNDSSKYLFKNFFGSNFSNITHIYPIIDTFIYNIKAIIPEKFLTYGVQHYFCLRNKNSVLKRYCLFFRWMVRKDFPDFALYDFIDPAKLIYPVDIHILNFSYQKNIISSKNITRKNAIKITNYFKQFSPEDPLKYDFYITREMMLKNTFRY
ncbi:MAG: TIGR02757 family protein [Leptospiraceae bacterium]|nr:MAG: TIGR02757 family protein [Leptospiraceae bacterium]